MKTFTIIFFFIIHALTVSGQDFWEEIILPDTLAMSYSDILFDDNGTVYLGTLQGLFKSFNNGSSWEPTTLHTVASLMASAPDNAIHTITLCNEEPCLSKSNDYGNTWIQIYVWDDIPSFSSAYISSEYELIYGSMGGIYSSLDSGYSWTKDYSTGNSEIFNDFIQHGGNIYSGSVAYLVSTQGGVYQSPVNSSSWQQISLPGYGISSFELDFDSNLLCGVNFQYAGQEYGVLRSTDNGYTWENILSGHIVTSLAVDVNGGIYAGCDSDFGPEGVQFSPDNGISWSSLNTGLHENASITSLYLSPTGYLFAKTIFPTKLYRNINPIVNITSNYKPPQDLTLFPNPCNNILSFRFKDLHSSFHDQVYEVKIINYLGKVVISKSIILGLNNENSLNIAPLSSGLYVIVIYRSSEIFRAKLIKE